MKSFLSKINDFNLSKGIFNKIEGRKICLWQSAVLFKRTNWIEFVKIIQNWWASTSPIKQFNQNFVEKARLFSPQNLTVLIQSMLWSGGLWQCFSVILAN